MRLRARTILGLSAILAGIVAGIAIGEEPRTASPNPVDFRRDVFPILSGRCWECHLGAEPSSGIRLDVRGEWLGETTGQAWAIIGKSERSRVIEVLEGRDSKIVMPAEGERLKPTEIAMLRRWIDEGLVWDDDLLPPPKVKSDHWAFQPLAADMLRIPVARRSRNVLAATNPIDVFLDSAMVPEADRRVLVRRLSVDLLGLPPTSNEVEEFLADDSPDAVDRLVDRLLASPAYGERWGRHWLDVARWAESEGYESNHPRPFAWRYRDYVISAFNTDKPFDEFVRQQLAGDELQPYSDENLIATGFLAAARISSNEEDKWRQRNDVLVDIVNATGSAFWGLTLQCAQCHNHKTDPITTRDYYRMQAFFVTGQPIELALRDPVLRRDYELRRPVEYEPLLALREALLAKARQRFCDEARKELSAAERTALDFPSDQRSVEQELLARRADLKLQASSGVLERYVPEADRKLFDEVKKKLFELEKTAPRVPQTFGFYSPATSPHVLEILPSPGFYPLPFSRDALPRERGGIKIRGDVHNIGPVVTAGFPAALSSSAQSSPVALRQESPNASRLPDSSSPPSEQSTSTPQSAFPSRSDRATSARPTRLDFANWLTDPQHPLTARVWVNRLWQWHFGTGIVATADDFGIRGAKPSHPELLDWLASELIASGWSTKHIQRLIVTSHVYRRSSSVTGAPDAPNASHGVTRLLSFPRRRVEAEVLRDMQLAIAGLLERRIGGPSVGGLGESLEAREKSNRRNVYLFQKRGQPPSMQGLFDGPNEASESCPLRNVSTTPLHALFLLNNEFSLRCGNHLAQRIESLAGADRDRQVELLFRQVLNRQPTDSERLRIHQFLDEETAKRSGSQAQSTGPTPLQLLCHLLMSLSELSSIE